MVNKGSSVADSVRFRPYTQLITHAISAALMGGNNVSLKFLQIQAHHLYVFFPLCNNIIISYIFICKKRWY